MELFFLWLASLVAAAIIGSHHGHGARGFFLGLLIGPLGVLIELALGSNRHPCPFCKERIKNEAVVCPHCQRDLPDGSQVETFDEATGLPIQQSRAEIDARRRAENIIVLARGQEVK